MRKRLFKRKLGFIFLTFLVIVSCYLIVQGSFQESNSSNGSIHEDLALTAASGVNVTLEGNYYYLRNRFLELKVKNDTADQTLKSLVDDTIFYEGASEGRTIEITHVDGSFSGISLDMGTYSSTFLSIWAVNGSTYADLFIKYTTMANAPGINVTLHYRMYADDPGMELNYTIETPNSLPAGKAIRYLTAFGRLNLQTTLGSDGYFVLPFRSTGILIPLSYAKQDPSQGPNNGVYDAKYPGDWTMQFLGMVVDDSALLIYANDTYGYSKDCYIKFQSLYSYFQLSDYMIIESNTRYTLPYVWKFRLLPQQSDYVDVAKTYRQWANTTPFYEPIDEKIARHPELMNITRTGIALHGHHWGPSTSEWYSFSNSIEAMKKLKSMYGLTHAIIHESMWRKDHPGRFDDYYPEYTPPSSSRGGEAPYKSWASWLAQNGFVLLPHTDSVYWDDRTSAYQANYRHLDYDLDPTREEHWSESSWLMSQYAIRTIEQGITNDILNLGAGGRFLDVTGRGLTAYGEDYNTYVSAAYQPYGQIYGTKQFLDLQNATGAILGTEAFIEPLNPYFPYISGRIWLPYNETQMNFFGFRHAGEQRYVQVPLWSLVYHETTFLAEHDLFQHSAVDMYHPFAPYTEYGTMTRLENVENGALMMVGTLASLSYSQLAKEVIDYQKQFYHEIYNAELIDHYYINDGVLVEDALTWKVAVSVFKNPNDEYLISVCNYDSNTFTKTWLDNNSGRTIEVNGLASMDWHTIHINRSVDDLSIVYAISTTSVDSGNFVSLNVTVTNEGSPVNNAKVEVIIGKETFYTYTNTLGVGSFYIAPTTTGTHEAEIVAIKAGFDFGRRIFTFTVQGAGIPGLSIMYVLMGIIGLASCLLYRQSKYRDFTLGIS